MTVPFQFCLQAGIYFFIDAFSVRMEHVSGGRDAAETNYEYKTAEIVSVMCRTDAHLQLRRCSAVRDRRHESLCDRKVSVRLTVPVSVSESQKGKQTGE
jgi:hypothetical protein